MSEKNTERYMQEEYEKVFNPLFDVKEIHNLNQYLYDNSINLSKSQKTLFIASILICLKIDKDIIADYNETTNSYLIADKMINIINNYYDDKIFLIFLLLLESQFIINIYFISLIC